MAFGTFFKKLWNGVKNVAQKVAPVVQKGLEIASKIAPVVGGIVSSMGRPDIGAAISAGGGIAGEAGKVIGNIRDGKYSDAGSGVSNMIRDGKNIRDTAYRRKMLGEGGAGQRFINPILK